MSKIDIEKLLLLVQEQNLETVRLSFADQHGILRGKTIAVSQLEETLKNGLAVTSTLLLKDTSHTTVFPIWTPDQQLQELRMAGGCDLLMMPDVSTFKVLPWVKNCGWVLCDLHYMDGTPVAVSTRYQLKQAMGLLSEKGFGLVCGLEVEFYVYQMEDPRLQHGNSGKPEDPPETSLLAHGYQYLTEQREDSLESVMTLLRRHAEALFLPVRSVESEFGPSQFEFTFEPGNPMQVADNMMLFRNMVKQVCRRNNLHATFMCKPKIKNALASGWHLHQSLQTLKNGVNAFAHDNNQRLSDVGMHWLAGLLCHATDCSLLSTPTVNGYKRYQANSLAPDRAQWGLDNRGVMLRVIGADTQAARIENRGGEPAANPYLYMASQIYAGMSGMSQQLSAGGPSTNPYEGGCDDVFMPSNLGEAINCFEKSELFVASFGAQFVKYFCTIKRAEWKRYLQDVSEWEQREYFSLF